MNVLNYISLFFLMILHVFKSLNVGIFHFPIAESHHEILQSLIDLIQNDDSNHSIVIYTTEYDYKKFLNLNKNTKYISYIRYGNYTQGTNFLENFNKTSSPIDQLSLFLNFLNELCENLLELNDEIAYRKNNPFDLIISDITFRCAYNFIKQIEAKNVVYLIPVPILPNCRISIETLSYLPYITTPYNEELTFVQRISNLFQHLFVYSIDRYSLNLMNKINSNKNYSILNSHCEEEHGLYLIQMIPGYDYSLPLTQNMIPVGSLLSDLGDFNKTSQSVKQFFDKFDSITLIDFSKSLKLTKMNVFKEIISVFNKIGFILVLNDNLSFHFENNKNKNLLIINDKYKENFIYNDILVNKKLKLFIFPAFQNLIYQAIYHEVNIIAIGISLDQVQNAAKINYRKIGYGIMNEDDLNFDDLKEKILDCIFNSTFNIKLNYYSKISKNYNYKQIFNEVLTLSNSIGFDHLLPKRIYSLKFLQYYNLDIIIILIGFIVFICVVIYFLVKKFLKQILLRYKIKQN